MAALPHHTNTSSTHYPITPIPHHPITSSPHHPITRMPYHRASPSPHHPSIIPSPHHRIAALPYHTNTSSTPYPPPHHPNTPSPHYPIAGRERQNTWRIAAYGAEPKCLENIRLRLLWPIKSMAYGIGAYGIWHYGPLPSKFGCLPNAIGLQNRVTLTPVAPDRNA